MSPVPLRKLQGRFVSNVLGLAVAVALAQGAQAEALKGSTPLVSQTRTFSELVIADGQMLVAPPGKQLVLTVNGVDTAIKPGRYTGTVVLTVIDTIPVKYHDLPEAAFRAGLYINDNRVVPEKSVTSAVVGGRYDGNSAQDIKITSHEDMFNGVIVTGNSKYTLERPVIEMVGNGGNDFAGWGAAIMATGNADLTINSPRIHTKGAVRTAVFVGGHSTVHVNDADIYTESGTLPADYVETLKVGRMKEVPWQLSLSGNVRATNLVDNGTVYYTHSHIRSSGWGVLSVDDSAVTRMYVKDSLIETFDSGYGAYSIGDSIDTFDHSTLNVADYGLIAAGQGSAVFTNGTVVNSRRFGVMMFDRNGGGQLTLEKGCTFNTRLTGILVKGRGAVVNLDDAQINAGNGILLHAMVEDNPRKVEQKLAAERAAHDKSGTRPDAPIVGERTVNPMGPDSGPDVVVNLKHAALVGDLLNTRTAEGELKVNLEATRLHGAISTGTQKPITPMPLVRANFWQIGEVTTALGPGPGPHGVAVALRDGASWTVTRTSYLSSLSLDSGSKILAPDGHRLTLKVDGTPTPIKPGAHYQGHLILEVASL